MLTNKFPKLFLLGMIAILLEGPAQTQAQIIVLSSPSWSQATMGIGTGSYAPAWNTYGLPPEYPVTFAMPLPYSINPDSCNGIASAGRSYVSGSISCGPGQSTASAGSTYRMDVYADVVPDSNVRVKFQANFNINWYGYAAEAENVAGFNFYATVGDNVGAQVNRITAPYLLNGTLENSGQWAAAVRPPANSAYVSGGKTYYKLGMVETIGSGSLHAATANARYSSAIAGIEAHYIGKALSKVNDTDNQTRLVENELQKPLSAQVGEDDPEAIVSGIPITFSIIDPVNGAEFSNSGTSIVAVTESAGIASVGFKLGTAVGAYKIKATCPDNICTSGAREVTFTATAISSFTDVTGEVPDGCTKVAIGDRSAQVDPVTNSFRIFNVPLVINSPVNLFWPEIIVTCNNDAECPVTNAQRVPDICAKGNFAAPRVNGGTHDGIDLGLGDGDSILSATQGTVVYIGQFNNKKDPNKSWGTVILIQSTRRVGDEYEVLMYGHLDPKKLHVRTGDPVSAGQQVAVASLNGATGNIRSVLDGNPPDQDARPQCLHVHVERRLLAEPLTILGFPLPCAIPSDPLMSQCKGPDMNSNANGNTFGEGTPTDPDAAIGCNMYR